MEPLPESEAHVIPFPLTSKAGGPVAVKAAPNGKTGALEPQTQQFLVYIDIVNPDDAVQVRQHGGGEDQLSAGDVPAVGLALVNTTFDLRLM